MMIALLILSVILAVCKSAAYNRYAKSERPDPGGIFRFNAISYGAAAVVTLCFGIGNSLSPATLLSALAYAITVFSLQALSVAAMTVGPMSTTSLMVLYGMIIPALAGPIFWHEPFGPLQAAGIPVMLISLWMLREKDDKKNPAGKRWAFMAGLCFLLSGMAGVFEKIHQSTNGREERRMFLFSAFTIMFLLSLIGWLSRKKHSRPPTSRRSVLLIGGISGLIVSLYSQINLTLAGNLDSLIYYPIANGGALLLTVLISAVVFRETLTGKRLAGFLIGLASIILLSLPL